MIQFQAKHDIFLARLGGKSIPVRSHSRAGHGQNPFRTHCPGHSRWGLQSMKLVHQAKAVASGWRAAGAVANSAFTLATVLATVRPYFSRRWSTLEACSMNWSG